MSTPSSPLTAVTKPPVDQQRSAPEAPPTYSFGPFTFDVPGQRLLKNGEVVPLTGRALDTLLALIRHRDRLVTKDELLQMVWQDTNVSEDSLTHNISILRRTFGDDATRPRYIATSARRGYRFIAETVESAVPVVVASQEPLTEAPKPAIHHASWPVLRLVVIALVTGAAVTVAVHWPQMSADEVVIRALFSLDPPPGEALVSNGVLSPDGRYIAFVGQDAENNIRRLWVRSIETGEMRRLAGTEGVWRAFWSPDSRALGFFADLRIKRVGLGSDDPPRVIGATIGSKPDGSWGTSDVIVYADSMNIYTIPATGGTPSIIRKAAPNGDEYALGSPQLLQDGKHLLYTVASANPDRAGTYFGELRSSQRDVRVLPESSAEGGVAYAHPGYLLFVRNGVVMAQRFDATSGRVYGPALPLTGRTVTNAAVSASSTDIVSFGGGAITEELAWIDRGGRTLSHLTDIRPLYNPVLSPDGRQVLGDAPGLNAGSWLVDFERSVAAAVPMEGARQPTWSPDGTRIAFTAQRGEVRGIYIRPVQGGRADELVLQTNETKFVTDWTRDDRFLIYASWNESTKQDLWILPLSGDRRAQPFRRTAAREFDGRVSPDGRWITYLSDESGRLEVYIDSFPEPSAPMTISNSGGWQPKWRADGRELFYLANDGSLMAVDIAAGPRLRVGPARRLFQIRLTDYYRHVYAPAADGQRFLVVSPAVGAASEHITVLTNWSAAWRAQTEARNALSRLTGLLQ